MEETQAIILKEEKEKAIRFFDKEEIKRLKSKIDYYENRDKNFYNLEEKMISDLYYKFGPENEYVIIFGTLKIRYENKYEELLQAERVLNSSIKDRDKKILYLYKKIFKLEEKLKKIRTNYVKSLRLIRKMRQKNRKDLRDFIRRKRQEKK